MKIVNVDLWPTYICSYTSMNMCTVHVNYGTMRYVHVRTCAQLVKFDSARAEGLYDFFNGKYFKGIWKMLFGRRQKSE